GSLNTARYECKAILLPNGKVLVAGGTTATLVTNSSELYDPGTGNWTPSGTMLFARRDYASTLLPNGRVLVTGGAGGGTVLAAAETYNPATEIWSFAGFMSTNRFLHTATLLTDGKVLISGGTDAAAHSLGTAETYDPTAGVNGDWTGFATPMNSPRSAP